MKLTEAVWNLPNHYETSYDAGLKHSETLWNLPNSDVYTAICEQHSEAQPTRTKLEQFDESFEAEQMRSEALQTETEVALSWTTFGMETAIQAGRGGKPV